jgi:hypothetical protein
MIQDSSCCTACNVHPHKALKPAVSPSIPKSFWKHPHFLSSSISIPLETENGREIQIDK